MTKELIERLREDADGIRKRYGDDIRLITDEAADALEAQAAEIAALRDQCAALAGALELVSQRCGPLAADGAQAKAALTAYRQFQKDRDNAG